MYKEIEPNSERWFDFNLLENEIWRDIKGYEGLYQVSNYGRVKSIERKRWNRFDYIATPERILKARVDKKGYIKYALYKNGKQKNINGHKLVIQAFIKNVYNKPQINHKDGNKLNNKLNNLEYCTNRENQIHALEHGLTKNKRRLKYYKQEARKCLDKYRNIAIKLAKEKNSKKVYVYDKNTNKLLYTFKSRREAQKELKVTHIGEYINGIRKNNKKYIFKEEKYDI